MKRAALNPMSARRRAELAQQGVNFPTSTFVPSDPKLAVPRQPKRPRDTGPDKATVDLVLERDGYSCSVCGEGLHGPRGEAWSIHHRVRRSHDARVEELLSRMTKRERALVREAAVMANVRGGMRVSAEYYKHKPPLDSQVLHDTLAACLSMPDLYPTMTRLLNRKRRRSS